MFVIWVGKLSLRRTNRGRQAWTGASCLSERSLPCLNNRPIWCGQGCHSGVSERGFGDAKAVKPLRMKAYGCPEVFLNVFKRQNSLLLPYLGLAQQPARRGVRVFRWLRCRGGRQGFPAGSPSSRQSRDAGEWRFARFSRLPPFGAEMPSEPFRRHFAAFFNIPPSAKTAAPRLACWLGLWFALRPVRLQMPAVRIRRPVRRRAPC